MSVPAYPWLQPAWARYQARLASDRVAHALLLHGPAGTGKSLLAHDMVAGLLCLEPDQGRACGDCRSCQLLAGGAHPDVFFLRPEEGKHQILIDDVRDTIRSLSFTTTISRRKVALLEPAEAMNRNAANALLKSLEEPPGDTVLILLSHDPSRLPVTIRSRCQAIGVEMPSEQDATRWLMEAEGMSGEQARMALEAAGGSPLRAAGFQQQGLVPLYQQVRDEFRSLAGHSMGVAAVLPAWQEVEADTLWLWLSGLAADQLRLAVAGKAGDCGRLARLQQKADRNRQLARTAVRGDLLLRDWLLEWAAARPRATG